MALPATLGRYGQSIISGNVSRTAGGANVTITGGGKLRRFFAAADRLNDHKIAEIMARILRRILLPELRSQVPRRTGKLQRSLVIIQRGAAGELRGIFYGRFIAAGPSRDNVAAIAMRIIESRRPEIYQQLKLALRQELGV